jgi:hypothetical protein
MRARHVIAVAFILVCVVVKLTFFTAPIAEADARSIASGSVDVFQIHRNVTKLPVQNVHDMSLVFPSPPA